MNHSILTMLDFCPGSLEWSCIIENNYICKTYMVVFICALAKVEFLISNEAEQKGMGFITIEVQSDPTAKICKNEVYNDILLMILVM